jgi:hypothetical protein
MFITLIRRFQCFSTIAKRDRFECLKRSLSIAHLMASGDTCPQGTSNAAVVATLAGLQFCKEDHGTSDQSCRAASGKVSKTFR